MMREDSRGSVIYTISTDQATVIKAAEEWVEPGKSYTLDAKSGCGDVCVSGVSGPGRVPASDVDQLS
jgi:hypothetical protein